MFDILMYLFENYVHSEVEMLVDEDELTKELTRAGFHQSEIIKALSWLERLAELQESDTPYLRGILNIPSASTPKMKWKNWTSSAVVSCCSWSRFGC